MLDAVKKFAMSTTIIYVIVVMDRIKSLSKWFRFETWTSRVSPLIAALVLRREGGENKWGGSKWLASV